jgi:hypothetical protein
MAGETAMNVSKANDRRKCVALWLVSAYLVIIAGLAGWWGTELWTWQHISLVVLPPVIVALPLAVSDLRRNPYIGTLILGLVMLLFAGVAIGGMGLILAWIVAEWTGRWSAPATRAVAGVVLAGLGSGMM